MTTVTIGKDAPAPAENTRERPQTEQALSAGFEKPYVSRPNAPARARKSLPLMVIFAAQLIISAAAGLFVYLSTLFGSEELRAAVTEAVKSVING